MDAHTLSSISSELLNNPAVPRRTEQSDRHLPNRDSVVEICRRFLALLFPGFYLKQHVFCGHHETFIRQILLEAEELLAEQVRHAQLFTAHCSDVSPDQSAQVRHIEAKVDATLATFFAQLPEISGQIATDVQAAFDNDPAAQSHLEIVAAYPGIEAIAVQRVAHALYKLHVPLIPRMMTEVAHSRTGIDIHPGAQIGNYFAIDHGTGIVIGETCVIGEHCMLYHGVTLGAFNPLAKNDSGELERGSSNKRHPDLENNVTVYPGATILGGDTRVGHHSIIGGNVWLTHSVEPYSRVTMKDPELLVRQRRPGKTVPLDFSI